MQVDNRKSINFGSTMVLAKKLTPKQSAKLVEDFRLLDPFSPFKIYDQPVDNIKSITSVIEENNHFLHKFLKKIGVGVKEEIPSFCYFYDKFNKGDVHDTLVKTRNYMHESNWILPRHLTKKEV